MRRPAVLHLLRTWPPAATHVADLIGGTTATRAVVLCERRGAPVSLAAPAQPVTVRGLAGRAPAGSAAQTALMLAVAASERGRLVHAHESSQFDAATRLAQQLRVPLVMTAGPGAEDDPRLAAADLVLVTDDAGAELAAQVTPQVRVLRPGVALPEPAHPPRVRALDTVPDAVELAAELTRGTVLVAPPRLPIDGPVVRAAEVDAEVRALQNDPARLAEASRSARAWAVARHELGARAAELEEHYCCLLETGEPAPQRPAPPELPTVGVVVVTHQRRELLAKALNALDAQTYPRELVDVVVVDNGTTDGTSELLAAHGGVRVLREERNTPPAVARNRAAAVVRGAVLAFTDDDCRPVPTWLESLVAGMAPGVGLVQGKTVADPEQALPPLSRAQWTPAEFGLYETCNIAYRREAFDAVGGFDEEFAVEVADTLGPRYAALPFGEDTDLGWRVRRRGVASRFSSTAVVRHHVFPPDPRYLLQRASLSAAFPVLVRRTPELREVFLWRQVFLGSARLRVWGVVLGTAAAVATRSPLPATAALPYLWSVVRPAQPGWRQRLKAAPVVAARDGIETAALVRGSVRARSPVL